MSNEDWYASRSKESVFYLPEIKQKYIQGRVKHQRTVAEWARRESERMMENGGNRSNRETAGHTFEDELSYRRQLREKQLALSKLKYRRLNQLLDLAKVDRPQLSIELPSSKKFDNDSLNPHLLYGTPIHTERLLSKYPILKDHFKRSEKSNIFASMYPGNASSFLPPYSYNPSSGSQVPQWPYEVYLHNVLHSERARMASLTTKRMGPRELGGPYYVAETMTPGV